ncbi:hypothetical protein RI367_000335 [Sorochytrium milnesiophthora]
MPPLTPLLMLLALTLISAPRDAHGWGGIGHATIGALTTQLLPASSPAHKQLMVLLVNVSGDLSQVSSWADQIKRQPRFRHTAQLHYSDAHDDPPNACSYSMARDCPNRLCLTAAIKDYAMVVSGAANATASQATDVTSLMIADDDHDEDSKQSPRRRRRRGRNGRRRKNPPRRRPGRPQKPAPTPPEPEDPFTRRVEALKFLVHFVQDLHQPLHLSGRDRGGNGAKAIFTMKDVKKLTARTPRGPAGSTNLHTIWDTSILTKYARQLRAQQPVHTNATNVELLTKHVLDKIDTQWANETREWATCKDFGRSPAPEHRLLEVDLLQPEHHRSFHLASHTQAQGSILDCITEWATEVERLNCELVWPGYAPEIDLGGAYYERAIPAVLKLVAKGAVRLRAILEEVLF